MENLKWYPVNYNGFETNFLVTKCGRVKKIRVDWLKIKLDNLGEIDFSLKKKHPNGYLYAKVQIKSLGRKTLQIQQLIASAFLGYNWNGHKLVVDHINSVKHDNRVENLRLVTNRENCSKEKSNLRDLPTGVYYFKKTNKYVSNITINGKKVHLGYFTNIQLAYMAYKNKVNQL